MSKQLKESKKNGRSTSQISVYDYPEHLNPFYEDENHKRLRFWKIGTIKKQKSGRSNSFSLDGLKDMWAFKSFRLKKKSSTLGINKTSESPPTLRREIDPGYDTQSVNTNMRHTVNIGLSNNFQRNTGYRSSLQDVNGNVPDNKGIGFYRNDRYRNTIQNGYQTTPHSSSRYMYGGSVTPTPAARHINTRISHGSSQTSLNSTNPFDEDDDTISTIESVSGSSARRTGRKKRRAPPPPSSPSTFSQSPENQLKSTIAVSPSDTISENLRTDREASSDTHKILSNEEKQKTVEIHNLTAEIETFVKSADNNDVEQLHNNSKLIEKPTAAERKHIANRKVDDNNVIITSADSTITATTTTTTTVSTSKFIDNNRESPEKIRKSPENNEEYPDRLSESRDNSPDDNSSSQSSRISPDKLVNLNDTNNNEKNFKKSPIKIIIRRATEEEVIIDKALHSSSPPPQSPTGVIPLETESSVADASTNEKEVTLKINESTDNESIVTSSSTPPKGISENQCNEIKEKSPPPTTIISTTTDDIKNTELKITESTEDLTETTKTTIATTATTATTTTAATTTTTTSSTTSLESADKYRIRYVPLKTFSPQPLRREYNSRTYTDNGYHYNNINANNDDDDTITDIPPIAPERRRSVKDIIASINKSQSLLKINHQASQQNNENTINDGKRFISLDEISQNNNNNNMNNGKIKQQTQQLQRYQLSAATAPQHQTTESNESIIRNINELTESERQIKRLISEMEEQHSPTSIDLPLMVEQFEQHTNNSYRNDVVNNNHNDELFKKCVVRREKKTSQNIFGANDENGNNQPNLEWNPLPKPRRSRHSNEFGN